MFFNLINRTISIIDQAFCSISHISNDWHMDAYAHPVALKCAKLQIENSNCIHTNPLGV